MKLYRRYVKIAERDEMHLEVDHYLEPFELPTEEEIEEIIDKNTESYKEGVITLNCSIEDLSEAILTLLKPER